MHSVCRCSLPVWRRSFLKKGTPVTYFCPALDPPLGGSGQKTTTLVRDHEYFIPTKFHQNPSSGSGEEVENVKSLRTDDGRCAITIAHSSLRLGWANKSPKGHWSLTWVQWALLLKVRFLSRLPYLWNQSEQHQWRYFDSGCVDAFGLLLLHSDLKKKSFGEKAPHWPI